MASIHCGTTVAGATGGGAGTGGGGATGAGGAQSSATGAGGGVCSSAALCEPVQLLHNVMTNGPIENGSSAPANITAARCALQKLRDHATGSIQVFTDHGLGIPCGEVTELFSFGDGSASVSHRTYCDLAASGADPSVRREIKPQSYFDACLAGDDAGLFPCIASVTTDATVDGETCSCRGFVGGLAGSCVKASGI
jgi:hypothetical protein